MLKKAPTLGFFRFLKSDIIIAFYSLFIINYRKSEFRIFKNLFLNLFSLLCIIYYLFLDLKSASRYEKMDSCSPHGYCVLD